MVQQTIQRSWYALQPLALLKQSVGQLTIIAATEKANAHRENQKHAVSQYADTRDMEGGLTGETVSPRSANWHSLPESLLIWKQVRSTRSE
jgi:hypothetical protein